MEFNDPSLYYIDEDGIFEYDEDDEFVYLDIFKEKQEICTLSIGPERCYSGYDIILTGNAEICYRNVDGDEFDVIKIIDGIPKNDSLRIEMSKKIIKEFINSDEFYKLLDEDKFMDD